MVIKETDDKVSQATILDWDIKVDYNALAASTNWSPITSRIKSTIPMIGSNLDIDLTHDIYKITNDGHRIKDYNSLLYGVPIPSLTKFNLRTSFSFSGYRLLGFRELGNGEKVSVIAKTLVYDIGTTSELGAGKRRIAHLLGMYGTILFWIASAVMIFCYSSLSSNTPLVWPIIWHTGAIMTVLGGSWFWFF